MARKPASASEATFAGRWKTLFALAFGYFIDQGEGQAISVLFPTLQRLWGLSLTNLGTIGTIRNILQSVSAPFWGYAADKFPRKKVIIIGTGVWASGRCSAVSPRILASCWLSAPSPALAWAASCPRPSR